MVLIKMLTTALAQTLGQLLKKSHILTLIVVKLSVNCKTLQFRNKLSTGMNLKYKLSLVLNFVK